MIKMTSKIQCCQLCNVPRATRIRDGRSISAIGLDQKFTLKNQWNDLKETNFKKVDWEMLLLHKQINGRQVSIASHFEANDGHLTLTLATSVFKCLLPGNDFQFESNLFEIRKKPLVIVSRD
jgi:hypothetical protein